MYTISYPSGALRLDGVLIPQNDSLPEYKAYVVWLRADNGPTVLTDTEPPQPRIEVSAWQIRKALNVMSLRQAVEDAVAASGSITIQDGWYHSPTFWSDQPLTLQMGAALGKSESDMYALFQLAKGL